jgi:TonB family protein
MSHESGQRSHDHLGVLEGCLVEGDPEQQTRQRQVRRRALVLSVAVQSVIVAAILLVPLFGKPARIALANVTPLPPYYSRPVVRQASDVRHDVAPPKNSCGFCPGWTISQKVVPYDAPRTEDGSSAPRLDGIDIPGAEAPPPDYKGIAGPPPPRTEVPRPHLVHLAHIDPAMLIHRIEPVYPALMRQIGRSGRVELRAIIATDGTIQSLEAVAGDPGFYQSALDAVRQWRYTPTLLNGQQVQVDTYLTVIYNVRR